MCKYFISVLILFAAIAVNAQEWKNDLSEAKAIAKEKEQNIVLVFSGSDWCAPCMKLEKEILSSEEFKSFAKENFVLLKADFPRRGKNKLSKKQQEINNELAEKYNQQGYFPLVVVLDKEGNTLGTTGYKKTTPKEYIKILTSI